MLDTGAPHNLPYPELATDPPNGAAQIQALAEQTAARLGFVGQSVIATEQTRNINSFGLLTNPDRVQNVVIPNNSILQVGYHATMKVTGDGPSGQAAIFIGSNQVKRIQVGAGAPQAIIAAPTVAGFWRPLLTDARYGLVVLDDARDYAGDVSTGQLLGGGSNVDYEGGDGSSSHGGVAEFFVVTGGTFDVSVQFKGDVSTGVTVSVKDRKLWVRVLPS